MLADDLETSGKNTTVIAVAFRAVMLLFEL
jgi:hypothetical protein